MWVNKDLFEHLLADNKRQVDDLARSYGLYMESHTERMKLREQKAKDDVTIDWMRHRINALEKEKTMFVMKISGVALPTPEIAISRPGSISGTPDFDHLPSFEDVGDKEAQRLGLAHTDDGELVYVDKKVKA